VWTRASAGGGHIQIWSNSLFEFWMIPACRIPATRLKPSVGKR
jgi:hypothetical protein